MTRRLFLSMFILGILLLGGSLGAAMMLSAPGLGRSPTMFILALAALAGVAFLAVGLILYASLGNEERD